MPTGTIRAIQAALLATAAIPGAAMAQTAPLPAAPPAADSALTNQGIQDIVVTARRREESLQDVPISVGTVGAAELANRQIFSLTNLRQAVANVTVSKIPVAGGNYLTIRGVTGTSIPNVSVDSSIGIYIDGVYLGRPQSSGGDIADIERIEVNRGPQGTLFGRNSSGGTINFVTTPPSGEAKLAMSGIYGNFDRYRGQVSIDTPTFGGFSGRLTYVHDENGGDARNLSGGTVYDIAGFGRVRAADRLGSSNSDAVVAKLRYDGTDDLQIDYKFDYLDQREVYEGIQNSGFVPGQLGAAAAGIFLLQRPGAVPISTRRQRVFNLDFTGPASLRSWGHLLNASYDLDDDFTIRSISSIRRVKTFAGTDNDNGAYRFPVAAGVTIPFCVFCAVNSQKQRQFTQEVQLLGTLDAFNFILGGYYFRERAASDLFYGLFKPLIPGAGGQIAVTAQDLASGQLETAVNRSYAVFGHAEYDLTSQLQLAVGARYTMDRRRSIDRRPAPFASSASVRNNRFNYDVALTYEITPDINVYGRYATGYQSGGVIRGIRFRPEDNKTAEVGIKSEFFDRHVRLNAAVFHTRISDQQRAGVVLPQGLVVQNVGKTKIDGFEAELTVNPVQGLNLSTNFGYNDPRNSQDDFTLAPKTTFSFNAQYQTPDLGNGLYLLLESSGDYRGKYRGQGMLSRTSRNVVPDFNIPAPVFAGFPSQQAYLDSVFDNAVIGGYWLANARVSLMGIDLAGSRTRLSGFVRNVTNSRGRNYAVNVNTNVQASYERPRTYGIELGVEF